MVLAVNSSRQYATESEEGNGLIVLSIYHKVDERTKIS